MRECSNDKTLDRLDVNGDYCPENCQWATEAEQCNNRTVTKFVEYEGEKWPLGLLVRRRSELPYSIVYDRLRAGWDMKSALTDSKCESLREIYGKKN